MGNGKLYTAPAAKQLRHLVEPTDFQLFYDHGDADDAVAIAVWYGEPYTQPLRPKQLAHLDLAVVHAKSLRVVALIEIEDTSDNPKTLLIICKPRSGVSCPISGRTTPGLGPCCLIHL